MANHSNTPIPKKLLAQMQEAKKGHFEFDTSQPGPFRLPTLDEFEDAIKQGDRLFVLRFRDKDQKKSFQIPVEKDALQNMFLFLWDILPHFDKIGKK